jgi:sugar/nucleoside kinase (ribokinase family)
MTLPTIVTIGKATQDVFLKSTDAFTELVHKGVKYEQLPVGQKLDLDEVIFATGGNVTNAAVTFARQGLHSKYAWCLGLDVASEGILASLDKEGVDTSHVYQSNAFRASYSTVIMLAGGERTIKVQCRPLQIMSLTCRSLKMATGYIFHHLVIWNYLSGLFLEPQSTV